jgi:hypothetical protein
MKMEDVVQLTSRTRGINPNVMRKAYLDSLQGTSSARNVRQMLLSGLDPKVAATAGKNLNVKILSAKEFDSIPGAVGRDSFVRPVMGEDGVMRTQVFVRQGAKPDALIHEAGHIAQINDPKWAPKIQQLAAASNRETWRTLPRAQQLQLHQIEIDLELDNQRRLLRRIGSDPVARSKADFQIKLQQQRLADLRRARQDPNFNPDWYDPKNPPKLFAPKNSKPFSAYVNSAQVQPFIGTRLDPNNLPPGYLYGKIPLGKDRFGRDQFREVIYMARSNGDRVPLKIDRKGFIQWADEGEYRIVNSNYYNKNIQTIPGTGGKLLGADSQVHHLIPDNVIRRLGITQEALRRGIYNPDGTTNLLEMANQSVTSSRIQQVRQANPGAQLPDIKHFSGHPTYDALVQNLVNDEIAGRNIRQMTDREILDAIGNVQQELRRRIMNNDPSIPTTDGRISFNENANEGEVA